MSPSGNARPIASASTSGSPSSAAHATRLHAVAAADLAGHQRGDLGVPNHVSTASRRITASPPDPSFSIPTVGAPQPATGQHERVVGKVVEVETTSTGPCVAIAARAASVGAVDVAAAAGAEDGAAAA